jgi:hypothetical protein
MRFTPQESCILPMIVSMGDSFGLIKVSLITTFLQIQIIFAAAQHPTRDVFELAHYHQLCI